MGVVRAITVNAMARLNVEPTLIRVVLVPDATPRSVSGTEFIIEALFGEAKSPIPAPTNTRGTSN
jgi:hypothetical protein